MPESSAITTAPVDWNVRVPALKVPPLPRVTLVTPFTSARPVTSTLVAAASVIPAALSKSSDAAVFTPAMLVAESSWIVTAPAELNVRVPKSVVSPPPPRVMLPAPKAAPTVTDRLPLSVMEVKPVTPAAAAPFVRFSVPAPPAGVCANTTLSVALEFVTARTVTVLAAIVVGGAGLSPDRKSVSLSKPETAPKVEKRL